MLYVIKTNQIAVFVKLTVLVRGVGGNDVDSK